MSQVIGYYSYVAEVNTEKIILRKIEISNFDKQS